MLNTRIKGLPQMVDNMMKEDEQWSEVTAIIWKKKTICKS